MSFHSADVPAARMQALSGSLLELHRASRRLAFRDYLTFAFDRWAEVVPFDSALVATGVIERGLPEAHDYYLHNQPEALVESWVRVRRLDRVAVAAIASPGRTHAFHLPTLHEDEPKVLDHCQAFGLEHALGTISVDDRAGTYLGVSFYRHERHHPFRESDRLLTELFVPHLTEALRSARLAQFGAYTRPASQIPVSSALVTAAGLLLEAEADFVDVLCAGFPAWSGPRLPPELEELVGAQRAQTLSTHGLCFESSPSYDLRLLRVRRVTQVDTLTSRELEVAREFASGASAQEVGRALGIATNTVRVHLCRVYGKLGVVSKAELASVLAES